MSPVEPVKPQSSICRNVDGGLITNHVGQNDANRPWSEGASTIHAVVVQDDVKITCTTLGSYTDHTVIMSVCCYIIIHEPHIRTLSAESKQCQSVWSSRRAKMATPKTSVRMHKAKPTTMATQQSTIRGAGQRHCGSERQPALEFWHSWSHSLRRW
jgi:hypothetical protein